jgi:6-phosphogluconolactonase
MGRHGYRRTGSAAVAVLATVVMGFIAGPPALAAQTFVQVSGSPFSTGVGPNQVAFSPSGSLLATINSADGTISVFSIDRSTGGLTQVPGSPFAAGGDSSGLAFSPSGSLLATPICAEVVSHGACSQFGVSVFSVNPSTGSLSQVPGSPFATAPGAKAAAFSPSGNLLAVTTASSVTVFSVDSATGSLTQVPGSPFATGAGTGTNTTALAFDPSGSLLATANPASNSVTVFSVDSSTGSLSQAPGSPFAVGGEPYSVAFSPTGNLLATADLYSYNVSVFSVDSSTGALDEVPGSPFAGSPGVISVAFSPSGDLLATANQDTDNTSVYSVDSSTGRLTQMPGSPFADGGSVGIGSSVAFSPSGDLLATANDPVGGGSVSILRYTTASPQQLLSYSLEVTGPQASIAKLLRTGKESLPVTAPAAGREQIVWEYNVPHPRAAEKRELLIASGSKTFTHPETSTIVIHLTAAGRAQLEHTKRITLTAVGSFTPKHGKNTTARRRIELLIH